MTEFEKGETYMAKSLAHIAERKAFEMTLNSIIKKSRNQDLASVMLPLVDKVEKIMGDDWEGKFDFLKEEGCEVVYLPRTPEISSSQIKEDLHTTEKQK